MILRNSLNTFTAEFENPIATPIYNTNSTITIGGIVKSQTDSKRLRILTQIPITQSTLPDLELITDNFTLPMFYTPSCKIYNRQTIGEIQVIMTKAPEVDQRIYYSDKLFYLSYEFEEVLTS